LIFVCPFEGVVHFENGKWIEHVQGEKGKEITITRWVDQNDQQNVVSLRFEKEKLISLIFLYYFILDIRI